MDPKARLGTVQRRKISIFFVGNQTNVLGRSACSLVVISTELSRQKKKKIETVCNNKRLYKIKCKLWRKSKELMGHVTELS